MYICIHLSSYVVGSIMTDNIYIRIPRTFLDRNYTLDVTNNLEPVGTNLSYLVESNVIAEILMNERRI